MELLPSLTMPHLAIVAAGVSLVVYFVRGRCKSPLHPQEFRQFKLIKKTTVNHNTRVFRFELPTPQSQLGLPIGQHLQLRATVNGAPVIRSYTPVTGDDERGYFELVVKVYARGENPKFPEGGKMSQYLDGMNIGDAIDIKGPTGRFDYKGEGRYRIKKGASGYTEGTVKRLGMIAGGTGITPMLQIMREILKNPNDKTEIHLLFANQTENDILLRDELEHYAKDKRVKVHYTLDRPPAGWHGKSGFVDLQMIMETMPPPARDTLVLMCGPGPMISMACKPNLLKYNFTDAQLFAF